MKPAITLAVLVALTGCLSIGTEARKEDPGTGEVWEGKQKITAWGGARAEAAGQQFVLEIEDGKKVTVRSGNEVIKPDTPNTIQDVTGLVTAIGTISAGAGQGSPEPDPGPQAPTDLSPNMRILPRK